MSNKPNRLYRYSRYTKFIFLISDIVLLNLASLLSYWIRYGSLTMMLSTESQSVLFLKNLLWIGLCLYFDAYTFMRVGHVENLLSRTIKILVLHLFSLITLIVFLNYDDISRLRLVCFSGIFFSELILCRLLFVRAFKHIRKAGYNFRNVIIIGAEKKGREIEQILSKDLSYGYKVLGFFDNEQTVGQSGVPVINTIANAKNYLSEHPVHEVYITTSHYIDGELDDLILYCEAKFIRLKFVPDFQEFTKSKRVQIDFYDHLPVISFRKEPLESAFNRVIKRVLDVLFSLSAIILIFPWLFPILMIAVKCGSKGSVFFKQERSGENNHSFWCYKFRTMRVNSLSDELQATRNDARITTIGRLMRQTNLDELPQFFNVLVGDMSVVGPRPHMLKHTEQYSELIHTYLVRHLIKPGITGWAQVNGFRGETNTLEQMQKRVEFDIWYIENWSFLLDVKIIFKTITNVFRGEKNAF